MLRKRSIDMNRSSN